MYLDIYFHIFIYQDMYLDIQHIQRLLTILQFQDIPILQVRQNQNTSANSPGLLIPYNV